MTHAEKLMIMAFGAFVAIAGLVMLFRGRSESRNVVKAFGAEFELSSPAIVVFLVGAGILIVPMFVSESNPPSGSVSRVDRAKPPVFSVNQPTGTPAGEPLVAQELEAEPNNEFEEATPMAIGTTIQGNLTGGDNDLFKFRTSPHSTQDVNLKIEFADKNVRFYFRVYNPQRGLEIDEDLTGNSVYERSFVARGDTEYIIRLVQIYNTTRYAISLSETQPP